MTVTNLDNQQGLQPYRFTIFLAAFLLFAVQLLLGKYLLPSFRGSPSASACPISFSRALGRFCRVGLPGLIRAAAPIGCTRSPILGLCWVSSAIHSWWSPGFH